MQSSPNVSVIVKTEIGSEPKHPKDQPRSVQLRGIKRKEVKGLLSYDFTMNVYVKYLHPSYG